MSIEEGMMLKSPWSFYEQIPNKEGQKTLLVSMWIHCCKSWKNHGLRSQIGYM